MYRANLFISIVVLFSGIYLFPAHSAHGIRLLIAGFPNHIIWLIIGSIAFVEIAIILFLVTKLMKPLRTIAPGGTDGAKKAISIIFHILLLSEHILLIFAIGNTIYPKIFYSLDGLYPQNFYNDTFALSVMAVYFFSTAVLFDISSKIKPSRME